jgi:chemotaxis protein CheX
MDVAMINPFISSAVNVFKVMMGIDVVKGAPAVKKQPYPSYEITGIVGLSGQAQGWIGISFSKVTALKVVSKMGGKELKVVGPELTDGIGELANIITGNAKKDLASYKLSISLPNVIIGKDHVLSSPSHLTIIVVPFASPTGNFTMEICLKT